MLAEASSLATATVVVASTAADFRFRDFDVDVDVGVDVGVGVDDPSDAASSFPDPFEVDVLAAEPAASTRSPLALSRRCTRPRDAAVPASPDSAMLSAPPSSARGFLARAAGSPVSGDDFGDDPAGSAAVAAEAAASASVVAAEAAVAVVAAAVGSTQVVSSVVRLW